MLRRLFSLIIFLAVVTGCFWFYRTLTLASPYDEAWTSHQQPLARSGAFLVVSDRAPPACRSRSGSTGL